MPAQSWHDRVMQGDEVEQRFGVELKPCPFCASSAVGLYIGYAPHVTCRSCGADGPAIEGRKADDMVRRHQAVMAWNARPVLAQTAKRYPE